MKSVFLGLAASTALLSGSAFAADLPSRSPAPAPAYVAPVSFYSWSGFYAGLNAGYGWNNSRWSALAPTVFNSFRTDGNGFVGGGHVGYNWQFGSLVAGLEGNLNFADIRGSAQCSTFAGTVCRTRQNYIGDIDLRLGYAIDRALLYATGGVAFTDYKFSQPAGAPPATFGSSSRTGWTVGGGLDYALTNNWVIGVAYKYYDFGSSNVGSTPPGTTARIRNDESTILGRISYRFGGPAGGVVARY